MNVANITITYITSDIGNTLFNESTMNMVDHDVHGDVKHRIWVRRFS